MKSLSFTPLPFLFVATAFSAEPAKLQEGLHIALIGNGLGSRVGSFPTFESEVQRRYAGQHLFIRNRCDEGEAPGFRPHSGRNAP